MQRLVIKTSYHLLDDETGDLDKFEVYTEDPIEKPKDLEILVDRHEEKVGKVERSLLARIKQNALRIESDEDTD